MVKAPDGSIRTFSERVDFHLVDLTYRDLEQVGDERAVYAMEAKNNLKDGPLTRATVAMVKGQYKLIHYFGYKGYEDVYELFDLVNDPEELENLYSSQSIAADLREELDAKIREVLDSE